MTLNEMAWLLATHPDPNVLDAREAVKLAERAAELTNNQDAVIVDTLAAAYAAAGQFDRAVGAAQEALALVSKGEDSEQAKEIRQRLELYSQAKQYTDTGRETSRTNWHRIPRGDASIGLSG